MSLQAKISKEGYDVLKETDPKNFIFDFTYNHLKTAKSGSYTQSVANNAEETTAITHSLGYIPMAMVYWRNTADSKWFIASADPEKTIGRFSISANCSLYCDNGSTYIKLWNYTGGTATFEVKYEIFYEGSE